MTRANHSRRPAEGAVAKSEEHRMSGSKLHSPRHARAAWSLLAGLILTLAACAPIDEGDDGAEETGTIPSGTGGGGAAGGELTIATGGTGGVYFPLGGGLAEVIGNNIEGYSASV